MTERTFTNNKGKRFYRVERPDIAELWTARQVIALHPGQTFHETPKAYEIWQDDPLLRVKRIDRRRVFWIVPKGDA